MALLGALVAVAALVLLAPFSTRDDEADASDVRDRGVLGWLRGWPNRPRPRLRFAFFGYDTSAALFIPVVCLAVLLAIGIGAVFMGDPALNAFLGLGLGVPLAVLLVLYLRRPISGGHRRSRR